MNRNRKKIMLSKSQKSQEDNDENEQKKIKENDSMD